MEREGFAYDLYAETQLHAGLLDLDAYRVLVISTHPEYWSREMYAAVKRWVFERGGRLVYLGGNGLNCEVSFPDDATVVGSYEQDVAHRAVLQLPRVHVARPWIGERLGLHLEHTVQVLVARERLNGVRKHVGQRSMGKRQRWRSAASASIPSELRVGAANV